VPGASPRKTPATGGGGGSTPTPTLPPGYTPTPPPAQTPSPTPPPIACGSAGGTCTAAQVASHNSAGNCWVIYNGYYYIVTSWVSIHPGGPAVFNSTTCGHDISAYLNGSASSAGQQHVHSSAAYSILDSYKVGPVQG
jgi:hypothetical protein